MANATAERALAADVRAWAVAKGLAKPTRGRLSKAAIAAYNAKHKRKF